MLSLFISAAAFAEQGFNTCSVTGGGYVEVTANLGITKNQVSGNIVITNASTTPLQSASISVVVKYKYLSRQSNDQFVTKTGSLPVYNKRWTGYITQSENIIINPMGSLPNGSEITSIDVSVNNPICK